MFIINTLNYMTRKVTLLFFSLGMSDIPKEKISKKYSSNNRFDWILTNVNKVRIKMLEKWGCQ